ncbi:GLUG motif-containing protein, partial [Desulfuromusa kysingii]|uniref:GLUG motif-containing protein n=1 Tax=Desulfuromusa kysingii TaxID=37625 RepID=UPI001FE0EDD3
MGHNDASTINNSYASGVVTGYLHVGGLVGYNNSSIDNSYASVAVTGRSFVGGLVGVNSSSTISNSYASGVVTGEDIYAGGLVGYNEVSSSINNSYASGAVIGQRFAAGLVGFNTTSSTISNSYASGAVTGWNAIGGLLGANDPDCTVTNSFWDTDTSGLEFSDGGTGKTTAEMMQLATFTGWDGAIWSFGAGQSVEGYGMSRPYLTNVTTEADRPNQTLLFADGWGDTSGDGAYTITNWTQLQNINTVVDQGYDFALSNDLGTATDGYTTQVKDGATLANGGEGWTPIGNFTTKFSGTFDGGDHTIDGLTINRSSDYQALFGYTYLATISNIGLTNINITGQDTVGGLVGRNASTLIINSYASGKVTGVSYVGGLVGYNSDSTISNSYVSGVVEGSHSGGLVGVNISSTISNSYASGKVTGVRYVGGLVGYNSDSTISNSYASGVVTDGNQHVGGLVGQHFGTGTVTNSFWDTETSGQESSAGGTGKTTAEMVNIATFTDTNTVGLESAWDEAIWSFGAGQSVEGYGISLPYLIDVTVEADLPDQTLLFAGGWGGLTEANDSITEADGRPYTITNWTQLQNINTVADQSYDFVLSNNLGTTTSGYTTQVKDGDTLANDGEGWLPIPSFTGIFDGDDHTIDGLTIDRSSTWYVGLFGSVDTNAAEIKNLGLINVNIKGLTDVGGLVGYLVSGTVDNCYSSGTVTGLHQYTGGLVGRTWKGTISNSYNTASVSGGLYDTGGLIGRINSGSISNSYSSGAVSGADYVGGLVGYADDSSISNSYNTGTVTGNYYNGGLVGHNNNNSTISNSYASGTVSGRGKIGGLVGANSTSTITNSYASVAVTGTESDVGGLVGRNDDDDSVTDSFWDTETSGQATSAGGTGKTTAEMTNSATFTNTSTDGLDIAWNEATWSFGAGQSVEGYELSLPYLTNVTTAADRPTTTLFASGWGGLTVGDQTGADGSAYTITGWTQLQNINTVIDQSYDFALSNNLDTTTDGYTTQVKDGNTLANGGEGWMPIGKESAAFTGTFDGGDYTIDGLTIARSSAGFIGLFGSVDTNAAEIKNLGLTNVNIEGLNDVGGLVGYLDSGTVDNCYSSGIVTGLDQYTGGLVGRTSEATISNSYSGGNVSGNDYIGGLVGGTYTTTVSNSYSSSNVSGDDYTGGLVGRISEGTISYSYSSGNVSGGDYIGGLVGHSSKATISNSYTSGVVTGTGNYVGGLVGDNFENASISNSYASGAVTGNIGVGGLVGYNHDFSTISNSYASGAVSGANAVGGLVGYDDSDGVSDSFWDTQTSEQTASDGGTGKTTEEMTNSATFNAWDESIWSFDAGSGDAVEGYEVASPYLTDVTREEDKEALSRSTLFAAGWGDTDGGGAYTITNWTQLQNINNVLAQGFDFVLSNDLGTATDGYTTQVQDGDTLANDGTGWAPIGIGYFDDDVKPDTDNSTPFIGTFDGNHYTIDGLTTDRLNTESQGLFGYILDTTISNIELTNVNITGQNAVGGLVGYSHGGSILNSYARGNVTGGIYVGGLAGVVSGSSIDNSYTSGTVTGLSIVGGLVGGNLTTTIGNSYSNSSVAGTNAVGGLVGMISEASTISNSYASGTVEGTNTVGGLVGYNEDDSVVSDSFWDTQTSGQETSAGGTDKTTAEMMQLATFSGWNIDAEGGSEKIWRIYEGFTSPLLRSFLTPLTVSATVSGSQVYDGTTDVTDLGNTPTYSTSPDANLLGTLAINTSSKNVATYTSGFNGSGLYSNQMSYDISYDLSGSVEVTVKALNVTGLIAADKVYNASVVASLSGTEAIINGASADDDGFYYTDDTVSLTGTATGEFANKNVGVGKTVTITGLSLTGADADNYNLIQQSGLTASITVRPITVTADDQSKVYGNDDPALSYQVTTGNLVGDDALAGNLSRTAGENVGSYTISAD